MSQNDHVKSTPVSRVQSASTAKGGASFPSVPVLKQQLKDENELDNINSIPIQKQANQQQIKSFASPDPYTRPFQLNNHITKDNETDPIIAFHPEAPVQKKNDTGLPDNLKTGVEALSGFSMDDVKVHYNSSKPTQLQAYAYAQGTDIHLAPGQERHLPHEAWHVAQQKQGRVQATMQLQQRAENQGSPGNGISVNDDAGLEREADIMGEKAANTVSGSFAHAGLSEQHERSGDKSLIQRKIGFEFELAGVSTYRIVNGHLTPHAKGAILTRELGYNITADINSDGSQLEFVTDQFDETDQNDLSNLDKVAMFISLDLERIVAASVGQGKVQASKVPGLNGGSPNDVFEPQRGKGFKDIAGQLQMTGGVNLKSLAKVVSGSAMPKRDDGAQGGSVYQDYAFNYQAYAPSGALQQPIFQAALGAVDGFVTELDDYKKGLTGKVRGALAAVVTLMAEVPLNMHGQLAMSGQAQFLARTDYSKILKMICDEAGIYLEKGSFASALLSTINQIAKPPLKLGDDVFPATYSSAGQSLTGVTIGNWAESVVPIPGKFWGRWQGKDLITKKHFPGTQAQKDELRAFGGFGDKTDPGNKIILEWRNFQSMYVDQLPFVIKGLAEYLANANV